jgi:Zn-dependent peptidase ImmA (M78 family)
MLIDYATVIGRAAWVRHQAGFIGHEPPYSTRQVFEIVFPNIAVAGADMPRGLTEMAVAEKTGRAVYYNRHVHHPLQRVGLMHGLYHHLTDIKGELGLRECNVTVRQLEIRSRSQKDPVELACDLFAAEILIPLDVLDEYAPADLYARDAVAKQALEDEYDTLASRFNVPKGFMKWRAHDLRALRRSHYNPAE